MTEEEIEAVVEDAAKVGGVVVASGSYPRAVSHDCEAKKRYRESCKVSD